MRTHQEIDQRSLALHRLVAAKIRRDPTLLNKAAHTAIVSDIQNPNTDLKVGLCLEPHDLAASKLTAGRDKDWLFVAQMLEHGIVDGTTLQQRLKGLPIPPETIKRLLLWITARSPR